MAISNVPANTAISAMQALPFSSMIGGPLKACIEAQAMAAKTSWEFIKEVGLNTDEKGQKSAVMVAFSFNKGGRMTQLNVPLLTIVPIPYIAINSVDINGIHGTVKHLENLCHACGHAFLTSLYSHVDG